MKNKKNCAVVKKVFNSISVLWIAYVFLGSLPYKFTGHEHTKHIFDTIWEWMSSLLWESIWAWFMKYWAYWTWGVELIVSIILLIPIVFYIIKLFWGLKEKQTPDFLLAIGWAWASLIMTWAVFFHLFTPLWTEVNWDWWSLFRAAVSIWVLWRILLAVNFKSLVNKFKK